MRFKNIYILAGHSLSDPGAGAALYGMTEAQLTRNLRDIIVECMEAAGVKVIIDDDKDSLRDVLRKIESTADDLIVDIHFNAATPAAKGVEAFVKEKNSVESSLALDLCTGIGGILKTKFRGVKTEQESNRGRLGIMREAAHVVLLEVCFISNAAEFSEYIKNEEYIAEEIARIILVHAK